VKIGLLERFGERGSVGLSYNSPLAREKVGKRVAKFQLLQTAILQILTGVIEDFVKILWGSGPDSAISARALESILKIMKTLKYLLTLAAVTGALTLSAKADLLPIGAEAFPGHNSPASNLIELGKFTDTTGLVLCDNFENLNGEDTTITVDPNSFLVVHYGKGPDGSAKGGGLEFFQVINGETSVTVPGTGSSEFGNGGISSVRVFCPGTVPDSGTTAMLLGSALTGLGLVRRYLKR